MAKLNQLKNVFIEITQGAGQGATTTKFVFQGNPDNYPTEIATAAAATIREATSADIADVLNVIVPVSALLKSGYFRHVKASGTNNNKKVTREILVPAAYTTEVIAAIKGATGGLSIGGALCTSASVGNRRSKVS